MSDGFYVTTFEGALAAIMDAIAAKRKCTRPTCTIYRGTLSAITPKLADGTCNFKHESFDFPRLCPNCKAVVYLGLAGLALFDGAKETGGSESSPIPPTNTGKTRGVN